MLTFVLIGMGVILLAILLIAYSSRNKNTLAAAHGDPHSVSSTDIPRNPNKKRAAGVGED